MKTPANHPRIRSSASTLLPALLAGVLCAAGASPLDAALSDDEVRLLLKRIEALEQTVQRQAELLEGKIDVLEKKQAMTDADAAHAARTTPKLTAGPGGFGITSPDKAFDLRIKGLVQFDARTFLDDGTSEDRLALRRIRTPFVGTIGKNYTFNITPEYAGTTAHATNSTVTLFDAWVGVKLTDDFSLTIGKFRSPVVLEGPDNRHFIEAPYTNHLAPNRDLGVEATGKLGDKVGYKLGLFGGATNNTTAFKSNNGRDLTVAGRLTCTPVKALAASVGFSYGNDKGSSITAVGLTNSGGVNSGGGNIIPAFTSDGTHIRISPAIEWYPGTPFSAVAEYIWAKVDHAAFGDVTNQAWRLTAGYVLTGEARSRSGVIPATPFDFSSGKWGAFEVVARVGGLLPDDDLTTAEALHYGVGLNWYLSRNFQLRLDLEQTELSGAAAAAINGGKDQTALLSRFQLSF